jgi:small subunit ribosomal protein S13
MRIKGINIPDKKHLEIALTAIYGIGRSRARQILDQAKVSYSAKAAEVSPEEEKKIRSLAESHVTEGDLKRVIGDNIKRLKEIKSYKGLRHSKNLPVRGQRTKTNSRTRRGNVRVTMGSGRRKVEKK